ncbi:MAG: helix-turn-helix transcriptional regulator [Bacteroidota bacterium]
MSEYAIIRRYSLLLEKLDHRHFPTLDELVNFMHQHGFEVHKRTVRRDIEHLRDDFAVEIAYDSHKQGYYLNEALSLNLNSFFRFLELSSTANVLADSLKDSKEAIEYLSFETAGRLKGISHLQSLLKAVQNNREVTFSYKRFDRDQKYSVRLHPMLLKEYQYRWYVTGYVQPGQDIRIFGLDRMSELVITDTVFDDSPREEIRTLFDSVVGLNYSDHDITEITLAVADNQWPYLKTLPLHDTQKVVDHHDEGVILSVKLRPNYEFKQRILMLGQNVEVLEPGWFREEVAETLQDVLESYQ